MGGKCLFLFPTSGVFSSPSIAVARQPAKCQDEKPHISLCIVYSDDEQQVGEKTHKKPNKQEHASISVLKDASLGPQTHNDCNDDQLCACVKLIADTESKQWTERS